jgi:hypothetical protein
VAIGSERSEGVLPVHDVKTNIDAKVIDPAIEPFLQQVQVNRRAWKYTGVCIPNQCVLEQIFKIGLHDFTYR